MSQGKIAIRVIPNSQEFRRDLKKMLERAERTMRIKLDVDTSPALRSIEKLQSHLKGLSTRVKVDVDYDTKGGPSTTTIPPVKVPIAPATLDARFVKRLKAEVEKATSRLEASIPVGVDGNHLREQAQAALDAFERHAKMEIPVSPEQAADWRKKLQDLKDDIEDLDPVITANADADTGMARAKLAVLTRPRWIDVSVRLTTSSLAKVATQLAALSGARLASDYIDRISTSLQNLDRSLPKIAAVATAVGSIGSLAFASLSGVLSLGAGLVSVSGAALALPAMLSGAAMGVTAIALAMKDAGEQLKTLGPAFKNLQKSASGAFWAEAKKPIIDMTRSVLPAFQRGLTNVAKQYGVMAAAMSSTLTKQLDTKSVDKMFGQLQAGVKAATPGMQSMLTAFIDLGKVGSTYLEPLGKSFSNLMAQFSQWVTVNKENGRLMGWIDAGIQGIKDLGSIIKSTSTILSGLYKAAQGAGAGNGLSALAATLQQISDIIATPKFQSALTTLFFGAKEGANALAAALGPIGDMLARLAPTLASVMKMAGQAVGELMTALSQALSTNDFASGLSTMFAGILVGIRGILPALPALASAFGAVMTTVGQLAANLGPVLGVAIQGLAPIVTSLLTAVQPLIPVLTQAFGTIIQAAMPVIQAIVPIIQALVAAILPIIPPLVQMVTALMPPLLSLFQAIAPAIAALAPVIATIVTAFAPLIQTVAEIVIPMVTSMLETFTVVFNALAPLISGVLNVVAGIIKAVLSVIKGDWSGAWNAIKGVASTIWNGIKSVISSVFNAIKGVITTVLGAIKGVWSNVWGAIKGVASTIWGGIKSAVSGAINAVKGTISNVMGAIKGVWTTTWGSIKDFLGKAWDGIKNGVKSGIDGVLGFFRGLWGQIKGAIGDIGGKMLSVGTDMIKGLINGINNMLGAVKDAVSNVVGGAVNWAKGLLGIHSPSRVFASIGNYLGQGFANGITGTRKQVQAATGKLVNDTKAAFGKREDLVKASNARIAKLQKQLAETTPNGTSNGQRNAARSTEKANQRVLDAQKRLAAAQSKLDKAKTKSAKSSAKSSVESAKKALASAKSSVKDAKLQTANANRSVKASNAKIAARQKDLKSQLAAEKANNKALRSGSRGSESALIRQLQSGQKQLDAIAVKRDAVVTKLKDAQKKLTSLQDDKAKYQGKVLEGLTSMGDVTGMGRTVNGMVANLTKARDKLVKFSQQIAQLKRAGLNSDAIDQIVQSGADAGSVTADALLKGGKSAIAQVNALQKQIRSASSSVASSAGAALYDAGIQAAQGLVKGLQSQEALLTKQAQRIANTMANAVKKALKIHSPSRVFRDDIGRMIPRGIVAGVDAETGNLRRTMANLVDVPDVGEASVGNGRASTTAINVYTNDPYQAAKETVREMKMGAL